MASLPGPSILGRPFGRFDEMSISSKIHPTSPSPGTASQAREPYRDASASCLAAALPDFHSSAFGRFDEILYLVERSSRDALPSLVSLRPADPSLVERSTGSTRRLVALKNLPSSPSPFRTSSVATATLRYPASLADRPGLLSGRSPQCGSPCRKKARK